ncbi:MAG: type I restriction-modification system subunit M N-terminal domain-containing protein [Planctomycetota bacterium]
MPTDTAPHPRRFTSFSEASSFIWSIADLLRGDYKQHDYGKVILPFTVLRRLDSVLAGRGRLAARTTRAPARPPRSRRAGTSLSDPTRHVLLAHSARGSGRPRPSDPARPSPDHLRQQLRRSVGRDARARRTGHDPVGLQLDTRGDRAGRVGVRVLVDRVLEGECLYVRRRAPAPGPIRCVLRLPMVWLRPQRRPQLRDSALQLRPEQQWRNCLVHVSGV